MRNAALTKIFINKMESLMKSSYRLLTLSVLAVGVAVLVIAFWHQQSELTRVRNAYETLAAQQTELSQSHVPIHRSTEKPSGAVSAPALGNTIAASPEIPASPTGEGEVSESIPKGKGLKPWQKTDLASPAPAPTGDRLILAETSAKPVADGVVATIKFNSTSNAPTDQLALVVRLDKRSDTRILNLEPSDLSNYTGVSHRVSENGKFAIFMGTIKDARSISFNLALSGPDTADVRGSCGITPFLLEVNTGGATVKNFPVR